MNDLQMQHCSRLSDSRSNSNGTNVSDSSVDTDSSIGIPPHFSQLLKDHRYTIQKELGQKGSGIVSLVHDEEENPYVIKKINSKNKKEVEILKSLEHGYIVTYVDLFEDKEAGLFVVMEDCAGGDLHQRMQAQKETGFFEEQQMQHCSRLSDSRSDRNGSNVSDSRSDRNGSNVSDSRSDRNGTIVSDSRSNSNGTIVSYSRSNRNGTIVSYSRSNRNESNVSDSRSDSNGTIVSDSRSDRNGSNVSDSRSDRNGTNVSDSRSDRNGTNVSDSRSDRNGTNVSDSSDDSDSSIGIPPHFSHKEAGLFVVMEDCAGGDLHQRIQAQKEPGFFEEQQILDWFVQICLALQYIHKKNVIHRDIKPQNIFLTEDDYINLGYFGCSKGLERADAYAESVVGADLYVSPEVLKNKYEFKSDIWSLGWLLHDLCMLHVWSDAIKRRVQHANSLRGNTPQISERYSEELRKLIQEMLSCDPTQRPSADEILAKPFLNNAANKNQRIPSGLEKRLKESFRIFDEAYNNHYPNFEALVEEWRVTTDSLEEVHRKCTIGSLSGSVIGAAGGITAVVGLILAPFTFGASLIVTGIGVGVGVAGGVTGAASSITNAVQQKSLRENIKRIQQNFTDVKPLFDSLNALRRVLKTVQKFKDFVSDSSDNVHVSHNVDRSRLVCGTELVRLGLLANIGRIFAQTARVGRAAAIAVAAVTGVLSGILVILDTFFIVQDSIDIHQMRQGQVDDPDKVTSSLLKSIAEIRKTHTDLCNVLKEIKETREELTKYNI